MLSGLKQNKTKQKASNERIVYLKISLNLNQDLLSGIK